MLLRAGAAGAPGRDDECSAERCYEAAPTGSSICPPWSVGGFRRFPVGSPAAGGWPVSVLDCWPPCRPPGRRWSARCRRCGSR